MIVVASRMSVLPWTKSTITSSSSVSLSRPWAIPIEASGTICCRRAATLWMSWIRLWTKNTCPSRASSRSIAARISDVSQRAGLVSTGIRFAGGRGQVRDVADPEHRHVERPRDRGGRHREHVDARPQGLEPLLHVHAEPLLLVDDHEAEVGEVDVGLGQAVGADHDVDLPCGPGPRACPAPRLVLVSRERARITKGNSANRSVKVRRCCSAEHGRGHEHGHLHAPPRPP